MSTRKIKNQSIHPQPIASDMAMDDTVLPIDNQLLKEEILRWILTICSAISVYVIVALVIFATYTPDVDALTKTAEQTVILFSLVLPEPIEALLFRAGIITVLAGLLGFYKLYSRIGLVKKLATGRAFTIVSSASIVVMAAVIWVGFAVHNESAPGKDRILPVIVDDPSNNNFNFFFDGFFIGKYLWLYAMAVVPAVACIFLMGIKQYKWDNRKAFRNVVLYAGYAVCGAMTLAILAMNMIEQPYKQDNLVDLNAVYYSMTQVYAGVPMLVDGFTNTYGLYPQFLNPLFQIIGLSVVKFSTTLSLLLGIAFVFNFYMLRKFVHNHLLLFLGFATMLFFSYLDRKLQNDFNCYFALFPIRYLVPSTLTFLATFYLYRPSQKLYWLTTALVATLILWNPEMGVVCYLSWLLLNIYTDSYNDSARLNFKKIISHIASGAATLVVVLFVYSLLILAFYGSWPDIGLLFRTMSVFSKLGFGLLPMALIHPWNIVALVITGGFTYAIAHWVKKTITPKSAMVFLLSLIGLGYLFYFQGRSHSVNLSVSSGFTVLLLTILADDLWLLAKKRNLPFLNALFVVFLFLLSFSFVELIYNADKIMACVYQEEDKAAFAQQTDFTEKNTNFILKRTVESERIHLLTQAKMQSLYFDNNKRIAAFNPGIIDMFFKSEHERMHNIVIDSSFKIFMEPEIFNYPYMFKTVAAIGALYERTDAANSMVLLTKRKTAIPRKRFLGGTAGMVIHRKYNDDKQGLNMRISDAFGIAPVTLNPVSSVQVLFYSRPQIYPYAALVGNLQAPTGFMIANELRSNLVFRVNNTPFQLKAVYNQWLYLVMNIYTDHVDIYQNGKLALSGPLPEPMRQSSQVLSVGNMGNPLYYMGAIAEVAVVNRAIDPGQVERTWEDIREVVHQ